MSSPPVDPWSGQPEPDPTYGVPPGWPNDWTTSGGPPPHDRGWPTVPQQPGVSPPPPVTAYPTLPYGAPLTPTNPYGTPAAPTSPYGGYPPQHGGYPPVPYPTPTPVGAPPAGRRPLSMAVTLSIIGVLAVLLGGGSLAFLALPDGETPDDGGKIDSSSAPTAPPSPDPTAGVTPSATDGSDRQIRLVTPETLAGRPRSTDTKLQNLANDMVREMKSELSDDTGVVGAFYGNPADRNMVMVVAASAFVLSPTAELDDAIEGITEDLSVTGMTTIAPGPLGGVAQCGNGKSADVSLGVCGWADHGSVGLVLVFFSSAAAAAAEFGTIRAAVELRD